MLVEFIFEAIINATQLQKLILATPDADPVNPDSFRAKAMNMFMKMLPQHMQPKESVPKKVLTARPPTHTTPANAGSRPDSSKRSWSPLSSHLAFLSRPQTPVVIDEKLVEDDVEEKASPKRRDSINGQKAKKARSSLLELQKKEQQILHDKYMIAYAVYTEKRKKFGAKMLQRRQKREADFQQMGMSQAMAKLAAYNELLLDEQHKIEDFDILYKPKMKRPNTKKPKSGRK